MKFKVPKVNPKYALVALLVLAVAGFAYMLNSGNVIQNNAKTVDQLERKRFTPDQSVDIAMAMKLVTHEPPRMLAPPEPVPPLLLFPPSEEDLARLSGPA